MLGSEGRTENSTALRNLPLDLDRSTRQDSWLPVRIVHCSVSAATKEQSAKGVVCLIEPYDIPGCIDAIGAGPRGSQIINLSVGSLRQRQGHRGNQEYD